MISNLWQLGMVNNTNIDWFFPWPEQALYAVASVSISPDVSLSSLLIVYTPYLSITLLLFSIKYLYFTLLKLSLYRYFKCVSLLMQGLSFDPFYYRLVITLKILYLITVSEWTCAKSIPGASSFSHGHGSRFRGKIQRGIPAETP